MEMWVGFGCNFGIGGHGGLMGTMIEWVDRR